MDKKSQKEISSLITQYNSYKIIFKIAKFMILIFSFLLIIQLVLPLFEQNISKSVSYWIIFAFSLFLIIMFIVVIMIIDNKDYSDIKKISYEKVFSVFLSFSMNYVVLFINFFISISILMSSINLISLITTDSNIEFLPIKAIIFDILLIISYILTIFSNISDCKFNGIQEYKYDSIFLKMDKIDKNIEKHLKKKNFKDLIEFLKNWIDFYSGLKYPKTYRNFNLLNSEIIDIYFDEDNISYYEELHILIEAIVKIHLSRDNRLQGEFLIVLKSLSDIIENKRKIIEQQKNKINKNVQIVEVSFAILSGICTIIFGFFQFKTIIMK